MRSWYFWQLRPVNLGGKNKVALRQSINLVRPDFQFDPAPRQVDIRVVPLLFGEFTDAIRKVEGLTKIFKRIRPLQMVFIDDRPPVIQLPV